MEVEHDITLGPFEAGQSIQADQKYAGRPVLGFRFFAVRT